MFVENNYRWKFDTHQRETYSLEIWPGLQFKNGAEIVISAAEFKIDSLPFDWILDEKMPFLPALIPHGIIPLF